MKPGSRILGIDDAPFTRADRSVLTVGVVLRGKTVEGVLSTRIVRDGSDATQRIIAMVRRSRFGTQIKAIMLNSVTLAGFNIVDIGALSAALGVPVITITRRRPRKHAVRRALAHLPAAARKLAFIEKAGPAFKESGFWVQCAGATRETVRSVLRACGIEPIRLAHIIASGVVRGESRGRT